MLTVYLGDQIKKGKYLKFLIIEHDAERARKHYDLRLQRDMTAPQSEFYDSWAIPKGFIGKFPKLAIRTEIHSLEGGEFEGVIEEGYGKGVLKIWDSGKLEYSKKKDDEISFLLKGKKVKGHFAFIKSKIGWLLIKKSQRNNKLQ